jgi:hypothetical protein
MHNELEARKAGKKGQHVYKFHQSKSPSLVGVGVGSGSRFPDPITDLIPAAPLQPASPVKSLAHGGLAAWNAVNHFPEVAARRLPDFARLEHIAVVILVNRLH